MLDDEARKLERKRKLLRGLLLIPLITLMYDSIKITISNNTEKEIDMLKYFWLDMIISMICVLPVTAMCNRLMVKIKKIVMNKYMTDILHNYRYIPDKGISESVFQSSDFIAQYKQYHASDCIMGTTEDNRKFAMCNVSVAADNNAEGHRRIIFEGIFAVLSRGENSNIDIKIYSDYKNKYMNQFVSGLKKMTDAKNIVRLENAEFERYFEVYSTNQVEARKKITVTFMEKLLEHAKKINQKITIFYMNNAVFLFIEYLNTIEEIQFYRKGFDEKLIEDTRENIKNIYELLNML